MKKLVLQLAAVLLLSVSFYACSEEEIAPAEYQKTKDGVVKVDKGF